ncbi:MAG: DUF1501 domain-containing protein [Luteolibacter sp.]
MKDEYSRTEAGQRMLLARRLIEGGVRFVSLTAGGWDHHDNIKATSRRQLPPVDKALAALIRDLERRGMLDSTLVMVTSEFGRTPKINPTGGRDHWPHVFSVMLAGGGVKQGYVHGSSDALGGEPETDKVTVEDLATTIYNQIGITADKELMSPGNGPIEIFDGGKVLDCRSSRRKHRPRPTVMLTGAGPRDLAALHAFSPKLSLIEPRRRTARYRGGNGVPWRTP